MRFSAIEVAAAVGGELDGLDVELTNVTIDSRAVEPGSLFVAVVAKRDGHVYVPHAVQAGASAYLTSEPPADVEAAAIVVADTAEGLLALGRHARSRLPDRVIGITGSVGKTTVKDLARAALAPRYAVHASDKSFNNELGVPLTLANAPDDTDVTVVEMGARAGILAVSLFAPSRSGHGRGARAHRVVRFDRGGGGGEGRARRILA